MELHTQIEIEIMKRWDAYQSDLNTHASYSDIAFKTKEVKNYIKRIDWSIEHLDNVIELCKKINFYYINRYFKKHALEIIGHLKNEAPLRAHRKINRPDN